MKLSEHSKTIIKPSYLLCAKKRRDSDTICGRLYFHGENNTRLIKGRESTRAMSHILPFESAAGAEACYLLIEILVLAVVNAARTLRSYFYVHVITMLTN